MHTQLIEYHTHGLALIVTLHDGNTIHVPIYGKPAIDLLLFYDLQVVKSHETYDEVEPRLKAAEPEKEESK